MRHMGQMGRMFEGRKAREAREKVEVEVKVKREAEAKARAEELKVQQINQARHGAWVKLHVLLCEEIYRGGRPRRADLQRWIRRMAGTSQMGAAFLGDLNTMFAMDVGVETVRAMLRLGLATQVIALNVADAEVTVAMDAAAAGLQLTANSSDEKGDSPSEQRVERAAVQSPFSAEKE